MGGWLTGRLAGWADRAGWLGGLIRTRAPAASAEEVRLHRNFTKDCIKKLIR